MTTSRADLLAGVDMEGGENFCDSVYNFLKNQGKDINLITNSGFGVWSQSDADKGLGICTVDSGSTVPTVGETVTGATSGATGKVMSMDNEAGNWGANAGTGDVNLGACVGRFNDNEDLNGSASGPNFATVDMPDAAVGVDLVRNGEFEAGVGGWTAVDCALAFVGGGQVGNCLQMTRTGGGSQHAHQAIIGVIGKIYKLSVYVKTGTSGNEAFGINIYDGINDNWTYGTSAAGWVRYTLTAECLGAGIRVEIYKLTATVGTMFFDEASCYEITPCCTGDADNLAFDTWEKDVTMDIYRQHSDGGTLTQDGSFYSLKMVPSVAGDSLRFPNSNIYGNNEWLQQVASRPVTAGMWVKTSTANHAYIRIRDGVSWFDSPYHSGGGAWEWLEVTASINATPTFVYLRIQCDGAPNVDGSTIIYASQPMMVFGWSLGEGMYQPRLQELIWLEKYITSNFFDGLLSQSDVAPTVMNLEADSDAKLPKGVKAFQLLSGINDFGSSGGTTYIYLQKDATKLFSYFNDVSGLVDDIVSFKPGWQDCDFAGDYQYRLNASAANTLDIDTYRYLAVQVN